MPRKSAFSALIFSKSLREFPQAVAILLDSTEWGHLDASTGLPSCMSFLGDHRGFLELAPLAALAIIEGWVLAKGAQWWGR